MRKISEKQGFGSRDPWIIRHDGQYYHCFTPDAKSVWISCAPSLEELGNAQGRQVYAPRAEEGYGALLWAPELHVIDDKCYIYAACSGTDHTQHRMCVLENGSSNPLATYRLHGKICDDTDQRAIDGTVMRYRDRLYFIWAGCKNEHTLTQELYIAQMSDPYTICGPRVMISEPDQAWEMKNSVGEYANLFINEGPCAFEEDGRHYVLYSANGGWDADYCMGLLELAGDDPMNARCWKKHDGSVLASNSVVLGPGHGSVLAGEHKVFFAGWDCEDPSPDWNSVKVWVAEYRFEDGEMCIL